MKKPSLALGAILSAEILVSGCASESPRDGTSEAPQVDAVQNLAGKRLQQLEVCLDQVGPKSIGALIWQERGSSRTYLTHPSEGGATLSSGPQGQEPFVHLKLGDHSFKDLYRDGTPEQASQKGADGRFVPTFDLDQGYYGTVSDGSGNEQAYSIASMQYAQAIRAVLQTCEEEVARLKAAEAKAASSSQVPSQVAQ
ncbi:MAG: hypothetical protein ACD_28C00126G0002 [uncultured bacterium]|nr:MAG: hypothetical protein ACD_28C00126G0002 [uncultured bacterium]KKT74278.1 MAG: hypothetical protein UW70_C0060G0004 [Candidatus Peregrinibacteria bacterium GW2011_GWA2_44_7]